MAFEKETADAVRQRRVRTILARAIFYGCLAWFVSLIWAPPVERAQAALDEFVRRDTALRGKTSAEGPEATRAAEQDRARTAAVAGLQRDFARVTADSRQRRLQVLILLGVLVALAIWVTAARRRDQEKLRAQLHFSEQVFDAIPLPISLRSPDGRFLQMNRAFEDRMGLKRETAVGQRVDEAILSTASARDILMMDARAAASPGPVSDTFHVDTPDGVHHLKVRVQAVRDFDGTLRGTVGIQSDLTTLVRSEAELKETNARLSQLSQRLLGAHEEERRRIARDLHDQVGQILTALKLQLSSLARRPGIEQPADALTVPIDLVEEALRHTRDLSASLHPHLLDDLGLEAALNWLVDRFIRPSLPNVELRCRLEPPRGSSAIELVAFRVVQEALTNVVRHAAASRVGVMLEVEDGSLAIEVIDDGRGFEAGDDWFDRQRVASVGVTSMRDRLAEVGGELRLDSSPGHGTSVRARLPWAAGTKEEA